DGHRVGQGAAAARGPDGRRLGPDDHRRLPGWCQPGDHGQPVDVPERQWAHADRPGAGGLALTPLAAGLAGDSLALANSVDAFEGARTAVLRAPGLFRLDAIVASDSMRVIVRNLSGAPVE